MDRELVDQSRLQILLARLSAAPCSSDAPPFVCCDVPPSHTRMPAELGRRRALRERHVFGAVPHRRDGAKEGAPTQDRMRLRQSAIRLAAQGRRAPTIARSARVRSRRRRILSLSGVLQARNPRLREAGIVRDTARTRLSRPESSIKGSIPTARWRSCKSLRSCPSGRPLRRVPFSARADCARERGACQAADARASRARRRALRSGSGVRARQVVRTISAAVSASVLQAAWTASGCVPTRVRSQ
jgi:hypothetical protein